MFYPVFSDSLVELLYEKRKGLLRKAGVILRKSRSMLIYNICDLIDEGAITMEDLEEFSDELKERVRTCLTVFKEPDED